MQEGMLYHAMLDPESSSYFTQLELFIEGDFDLEIFERSVNQLVRSYDILRTVFDFKEHVFRQVKSGCLNVPLILADPHLLPEFIPCGDILNMNLRLPLSQDDLARLLQLLMNENRSENIISL